MIFVKDERRLGLIVDLHIIPFPGPTQTGVVGIAFFRLARKGVVADREGSEGRIRRRITPFEVIESDFRRLPSNRPQTAVVDRIRGVEFEVKGAGVRIGHDSLELDDRERTFAPVIGVGKHARGPDAKGTARLRIGLSRVAQGKEDSRKYDSARLESRPKSVKNRHFFVVPR